MKVLNKVFTISQKTFFPTQRHDAQRFFLKNKLLALDFAVSSCRCVRTIENDYEIVISKHSRNTLLLSFRIKNAMLFLLELNFLYDDLLEDVLGKSCPPHGAELSNIFNLNAGF